LFQVIHTMYFMDTKDACIAQQRIISLLESARSDGMPDDVVEFVTSLMDAYLCVPKSLQELAELTMWKGARRHVPNLRSVHMPKALFMGISALFNLDL